MNSGESREVLRTVAVEGMLGWETRLVLIVYPAGGDDSGHAHPVPGAGYVLERMMVAAFDDDTEEFVSAGQSFQDKLAFIARSVMPARLNPTLFDCVHDQGW